MGFFKRFRSRSRLRRSSSTQTDQSRPPVPQMRYGPDMTKQLPNNVLTNIFSFVCPHTVDHSYEPCEQSQIGDGCMLCDLRDLAHAAQTCRKWYALAQRLLYGSIRIDAVHYCELEEVLAEKRRKAAKHFKSKAPPDPGEIPSIRLSLLCRTLRDNRRLGELALFLKVPYMTRETAKGDLARTVSACPNLRYVDLPDGFFTGDPSCFTLRQELQMRCHDIRKMAYYAGSEDALQLLTNRHWPAIEILEVSGVAVEPTMLRPVIASLPNLHELVLSDLPWLDDTMFQSFPGQYPDFPSVQALNLTNVPNLTAEGLQTWLQAARNRENLFSLTLQNTGIVLAELYRVLRAATSLRSLSILETVSRSIVIANQIPPLSSLSLRTMHFEIINSDEAHGLQKPADSYYLYLASSLHQKALPALATLYVRDQTFPELLILPPMAMPFAGSTDRGQPAGKANAPSQNPFGNRGNFNQTLEVFSKGVDELEWVFTSVAPGGPGHERSGSLSGGRPLSAYSASRGLGPQWAQAGFGGEARRSVVVGNGFGGFLAIPQEEAPRPMTADGANGSQFGARPQRSSFLFKPPPVLGGDGQNKRSSRLDLWR